MASAGGNSFLRAGRRLVYVIVNTPTGQPQYVMDILKANPYLQTMYENNKGEHLRKRDIERIGQPVPCGARVKMLPFELNTEFFNNNTEPCGPDFFDRLTAQYMLEQKKKS